MLGAVGLVGGAIGAIAGGGGGAALGGAAFEAALGAAAQALGGGGNIQEQIEQKIVEGGVSVMGGLMQRLAGEVLNAGMEDDGE